jgi:tetratricopeptide (TPR) repeat protein
MYEMTARNVSVWVLVIGILISLIVYFSLVGHMYLTTQKERDWQRDRLEGQRCYVSGNYQQAEKAYDAALQELSGYAASSEDLAATLNESGRIEALLDKKVVSEERYSKARSIYQQLLASSNEQTSSMKPRTASVLSGLLRSISGLANLSDASGQRAKAIEEYKQLLPLYVRWWQSQGLEVYEPDPQHKKSNSGKRESAVVSGAETSLCIQLVNDLSKYASICLEDGNVATAREVASLLADVCQKAPIDSAQKKKADLVYHLAFNLDKSGLDKSALDKSSLGTTPEHN